MDGDVVETPLMASLPLPACNLHFVEAQNFAYPHPSCKGIIESTTDAEGYTLLWKGDETANFAFCGSKMTSIVLPQVMRNPSKVKIFIKGSGTGTARSSNAALSFMGLPVSCFINH